MVVSVKKQIVLSARITIMRLAKIIPTSLLLVKIIAGVFSDRATGIRLGKPITTVHLVKTMTMVQHSLKVIVHLDKATKQRIKRSNNQHHKHNNRFNLLLDKISNRSSKVFQWEPKKMINLNNLLH